MSSFRSDFKNIRTGEIVSVFCHDGYFGRHQYGYLISGSNEYLTETEFLKDYTRV